MVVDVAPAGRPAGVVDYNIFPVCNKAKRFAKKACRSPVRSSQNENLSTSVNGRAVHEVQSELAENSIGKIRILDIQHDEQRVRRYLWYCL